MSEQENSETKIVPVDIEVLLKHGLIINPNDDIKVVVYSSDDIKRF